MEPPFRTHAVIDFSFIISVFIFILIGSRLGCCCFYIDPLASQLSNQEHELCQPKIVFKNKVLSLWPYGAMGRLVTLWCRDWTHW